MTPRRDHHHRAPVPEGWPGDDPTVPEDLALLGSRRRGRHDRRPPKATGNGDGPADRRAPAPPAPPGPSLDEPFVDDHPLDPPPAQPLTDPAGPTDDLAAASDPDGSPRRHDRRHDLRVDRGDHLDDDLVTGRQPAGRVLVVMVAALVLAMLVNADALVERAEGRPPGPDRDRALAVWRPVQDVSHALQLHRVRQLVDWSVGDDEAEPASPSPRDARRAPGAEADTTTTTTAAGSRPVSSGPELRTPTAGDPLRLWVGGDSMTQHFGSALAARAEATGVVDPVVHVEMASGLVRPDYFDWPVALVDEVVDRDREVVVFVAGVNDGQGIVLADGTPVPDVADPRWAEEYRRRAGSLMDRVRADDRLLVWVLLPPMADPGYGARQAVIREAVVAEAADRPWVVTVDATASVAGPDGRYAPTLPDPSGAPVEVRRTDGIHLTEAGSERLAAQVLGVIGTHVDLG